MLAGSTTPRWRPVIQLVGQGVAEIFQNGNKYIRGTWARTHDGKTGDDAKSLPARMIFFDENGEELEMKVGKTFIQIVNNDQAVIVNAGEQIEGATAQGPLRPRPRPRKPTSHPESRPAPRRPSAPTRRRRLSRARTTRRGCFLRRLIEQTHQEGESTCGSPSFSQKNGATKKRSRQAGTEHFKKQIFGVLDMGLLPHRPTKGAFRSPLLENLRAQILDFSLKYRFC